MYEGNSTMKAFKQILYSFVIAVLLWVCSFYSISAQNGENKEVATPPAYADELSELYERNVLRVAMYKGNTWPFYFQKEVDGKKGELEGIDVEIIKGFARQLGLEIEFLRSETIDGVIDMVAGGKADLAICKLSITFSRSTRVLFTKPYINLRKSLLVNRLKLQQLQKQLGNLSKKVTLQKLEGNLGILENSSYVTFANHRFKQKNLKKMTNAKWEDVVDNVLSGHYIAGFRDEAEIKKVIYDNKGLSVDLLTVVLENDFDPKGIALPSHANYLKALLDFYIDSLGLELTANAVIFDYDSVIDHFNHYNDKGSK
jgi:ABC-type amino acid transport substrate-binding protein